MSDKIALVCLVGPTGAGKTATALQIARRIPSSVINFDSRQVYRDFPVITAQPSKEEQAVCPHLLYGFAETHEKMSAAKFVNMAHEAIAEVTSQGRLPVLVGGTGLYLRTLLHGIADIPAIPDDVRASVQQRVVLEGSQAVHAELAGIDPDYAAKIHPNDPQRTARAMEVWLGTGKTLTWWHEQQPEDERYDFLKLGIGMSLDELTPRLSLRIEIMLELGALEEARAAMGNNDDPRAPGWSGIGCAEVLSFLRGEYDMQECRRLWMKNTRAYAKRQLTWFNKERDIEWFRPDQAVEAAERVVQWRRGLAD